MTNNKNWNETVGTHSSMCRVAKYIYTLKRELQHLDLNSIGRFELNDKHFVRLLQGSPKSAGNDLL